MENHQDKDKTEDDTNTALEDQIKAAIEDMQIDTLAGDLRDTLLIQFRDVNTAWSVMSEDKQRDFCHGIEIASRDLVRQAVRLLTDYRFPRCVVDLGELKIVGGDKARIEGKIVAANLPEYREVLGDHVNTKVLLLCIDSDTFMGEKEPAKVDPDQPDLPIDGSADVEAEAIASVMVRKARDLILRERKASTSFIQKRLAIGYNKAARIMEFLEAEGFVSAPDSVGKRSIIEEDGDEPEAT